MKTNNDQRRRASAGTRAVVLRWLLPLLATRLLRGANCSCSSHDEMRRPVALLVLLGLAAWPSSASYCSTQAEAACDSQPLCRAVSLYGQYFPGCAKPGCNIAYSGYKLHSCNITFASENWTTMTKAPSTAGKQPPPHCNVTARPCPHESHLSYCPSNPDPHQCADQANHGAFPGYLRANQHQVNDTACGKSVPQPASGPDGIACKPQPMSCTPAVAEGVPGSQACNTTATGIYPKRFNNTVGAAAITSGSLCRQVQFLTQTDLCPVLAGFRESVFSLECRASSVPVSLFVQCTPALD